MSIRSKKRALRKKKPPGRELRTISLRMHLSAEDATKLKFCAQAYPDNPALPEAAHRLLEMELYRDRRG
jgi:hypothetical protein